MSTTTTNTTANTTATGSDDETKIIIRAMFGVAAALTLITGLFFAHVWIYRVRRLRENEEENGANASSRNGRVRSRWLGLTGGFVSDVWTYVQKVRLANTLHTRFRDGTEADLSQEAGKSETCAICLGKMVASPATIDALKPQVLLCGHVYHRHCLRSWLDKESFTCPVCRASVWTGKNQKVEVEMNNSNATATSSSATANGEGNVPRAMLLLLRTTPITAAARVTRRRVARLRRLIGTRGITETSPRIFYADDELCPVKLLIKLDVLAAGSYIDSLAYPPRDFYHHPCHQLGGRLLRFLRLL
jgi:hypothetical protein